MNSSKQSGLPVGQISARPDIANMMYDPRIRRGPTQSKALHTTSVGRKTVKMSGTLRTANPIDMLASTLHLDKSSVKLHPSARVDVTRRQRGPEYHHLRAGTKQREEIDLTSFLTEEDSPREVSVCETQTDAMLPAPAPTPYRPPKTGVDAGTQVEHGTAEWKPEGEDGLFNFDHETSGLVDHLLDGILGQAETEVEHEVELVRLAAQRETMTGMLALDATRERELEAQIKAQIASKSSAVNAARERYAQQLCAIEKAAARGAAREMFAQAQEGAMSRGWRDGVLVDPVQQAIEKNVLPSVLAAVQAKLTALSTASAAADGALAGALVHAGEIYGARLAQEEADRNREVGIKVKVRILRRSEDVASAHGSLPASTPAVGDEPVEAVHVAEEGAGEDQQQHYTILHVGPVPVKRGDSVLAVEERIWSWVTSTRSRHTRRLQAMAGGKALVLCLGGVRLEGTTRLLDTSEEDLARKGLQLKPQAAFQAPAAEDEPVAPAHEGWAVDVPEEPFEVAQAD